MEWWVKAVYDLAMTGVPSHEEDAVRPRYGLAWSFALVGTIVSSVLGVMLGEWAGRQDRARFAHEADMLAAMLEQKMQRYESGLARVRDACGPSGGRVGRAAWLSWLNGSLGVTANYEGIGAIVVASREPGVVDATGAKEKDAFVVRQSTGYAGLMAPPLGEDLMVATNDRPSLLGALPSVFGWVPPGRSSLALADGTREEGFWYAVALRDPEPGASITWRLRGESEVEAAARRSRQRAEGATGLLAAFIRTDRFLQSFGATNVKMAHVWLFPDREVGPGDRPLNARIPGPSRPMFTEDIVMRWYSRRWVARVVSTPLFEAGSIRYRAWLGLGVGLMLSFTGGGALALQARAHARGLTLERRLAAMMRRQEELSRDLHDGTLQSVYGIGLGLERAGSLVRGDPDAASSHLKEAVHAVHRVVGELRNFIRSTTPGPSSAGTFSEVIRGVVRSAQVASAARIELQIDPGVDRGLTAMEALHLANIVREGLSNSIRHSGAATIHLNLTILEGGTLELEILDDGKGFDPAAADTGGMGLINVASRAEALGARHGLEGRLPQGTRLWVCLARGKETGGEGK